MNTPPTLYNKALENFRLGNIPLASQFCNQILAQQPDDIEALHLLGVIKLQIGNSFDAADLFNKIIVFRPKDAIAHLRLGRAQYMKGNLDEAVGEFVLALKYQIDLPNAQHLLESTKDEMEELDNLIDSLEKENQPPTIKFSAEEVKRRSPDLTTLNKATRLYKHFGYLIFEDVFTEKFISDLHDDFKNDSNYAKYFEKDSFDNALTVGNKRIMVSLKLQGLFNDSSFYANPLIMPVIAQLLGRRFIICGLGAVVSQPGAIRQHTHKDHRGLFEGIATDEKLPSFAITLGIPLIDMNDTNGTTRMYGKTHNQSCETLPDEEKKLGLNPIVRRGSCLLFDFRVMHEGTPNNSDNVRPLMYSVYSHAWFRDSQNYKKQKAVQVTDDEYQKIPDKYRNLFSWIYNE